MRNVIAFQKGFICTPITGVDNRHMAMNVQAELMKFGYMLDSEALDQLGHSDAADIKEFFTEVIDYLKEMTGGARVYNPIYPGFPAQVMEMTEYELWRNQLIGYLGGGSFKSDEWTKTKGTAFEHVKYKMISKGNEKDFANIFTTLVSSGTSLTPSDMKVIVWFINNYTFLEFPEVIPFKENLCTVLGTLIHSGRGFGTCKLPKLTATDILRIVVFMSGGDISLPAVPPQIVSIQQSSGWRKSYVKVENPEREKFKFKKFTRSERRMILGLLEKSNLDVREMKLKDQRWIRVGEILHPGEYATQFPKTFRVFQKLREEKVISWYGEVQKAFNMSFDVGLAKLSDRPGEFLRRLDWMLRTNGKERIQKILNTFATIAVGTSNKVLLEVYTHFEGRNNPTVGRKIFIKGARKATPLPDLPALSQSLIDSVQSTIFDTIKTKLAELPELGDCWIDEELKKIPLPTNMRSVSDSLVPMIRGQRMPFGEGKKVIRPFIHWNDPNGRTDLDLHGYLMSDTDTITFGFNGIHNSNLGCYSGDIRHRKGPCAEYVDINVKESLELGYRYFLMVVNDFNAMGLNQIEECVAGVQEREFPQSNSNWLPSTISNCMKLNSAAGVTLAAAYDLETREYIHLDLDFGKIGTRVSLHDSKAFMDAIKPYIVLPKVSVYDLLQWHVEARGRMVSKETATTHFLFEDFSSSYVKTLEYLGV